MRWLLLLAVIVLASCGADPVLPITNENCAPLGDLEFICGLTSPEDVVAVPYTDFVVVSGYLEGGGIHFVSTSDLSSLQVFPNEQPRQRHDAERYPQCPGPIELGEGDPFSAHGLNIEAVDDGLYHLYVVHHGVRESIEVFEIDTRYQGAVSVSAAPGFSWIGCVVAPEGVTLNSMSPLPGGGFVATAPFVPDLADPTQGIAEGAVSGAVYEWAPTGEWTRVPGSESPGPNGIEASSDGEWLYVNLWSAAQVLRLSRGRDPVEKQTVDLGFFPDNIRWQADGSLLTAGHSAPSLTRILECLQMLCEDVSTNVARVDPDTLGVSHLVDIPANEHFYTSTAALQVGDEIWIGSMRGDRVARYASPQ